MLTTFPPLKAKGPDGKGTVSVKRPSHMRRALAVAAWAARKAMDLI